MRVARPKWVPKSDEQRSAIEAVVRACAAVGVASEALRAAVVVADQLGVPRSHLAEASGQSRSTFYRRLPEADAGDADPGNP